MKNRSTLSTTTLSALCFLVFSYLVFPQKTQAVNPPPDGGYPGGNTAEGINALLSLTSGTYNTAVGMSSLQSDTVGAFNTGIGAGALLVNTGNQNTAIGTAALENNTIGGQNTAIGTGALANNTIGGGNTANGWSALYYNTTGDQNTAIGWAALEVNTIGDFNTAIGSAALGANTTGQNNTAIGDSALVYNTTGQNNTAIGADALRENATGNANTAIGNGALYLNTTGSNNVALGFSAGTNLTSGYNNIYLGSLGVVTESNTIRIGTSGTQNRAFIRGICGATTGNNDAIPVLIDTAGQLGTAGSSRRFKKEIKPMESASEAILALKPVTFHYKSNKANTPQFGLIAEEVAEVDPNLVARDKQGKPYSVRYEQVNAMLLNEFLKEHKRAQELSASVAKQDAAIVQQRKDFDAAAAQQQKNFRAIAAEHEREIQALTAIAKEQASQIRKVRAGLELTQAHSHTVLNDQ
jgi:hypothetical protein